MTCPICGDAAHDERVRCTPRAARRLLDGVEARRRLHWATLELGALVNAVNRMREHLGHIPFELVLAARPPGTGEIPPPPPGPTVEEVNV